MGFLPVYSEISYCMSSNTTLFSLQCNKEDELSFQGWPSLYNLHQKDSLVIVLAYICTDYSDHTMKKPCREIPKDLEEGSSVELIDSFISPSQNLAHYRERDDLTVMDSTLRAKSSARQKEYSEKDNLLERIDKVVNKDQNSTYSSREGFHSPRKMIMLNECGYLHQYLRACKYAQKGSMQLSRFLPILKTGQGCSDLVPLMKTSQSKPHCETVNSYDIFTQNVEELKPLMHRQMELTCNGESDHVVIVFPMQKYQKITMNRKKCSKLHSVYTRCSKKLVTWINDLGRKQEIKLSNIRRYISRSSRSYNKLNSQTLPELSMKMLPPVERKKADEDDFILVLEKINEVIRSMPKVSKNTCQSVAW